MIFFPTAWVILRWSRLSFLRGVFTLHYPPTFWILLSRGCSFSGGSHGFVPWRVRTQHGTLPQGWLCWVSTWLVDFHLSSTSMARCTEGEVGIRIIGRSMLFQYHSTPEALAKTDPIENNASLLECSLHILYPDICFMSMMSFVLWNRSTVRFSLISWLQKCYFPISF